MTNKVDVVYRLTEDKKWLVGYVEISRVAIPAVISKKVTMSRRTGNTKLDKAKKAGLTVTDIDPTKNDKLRDFIDKTEGTGKAVMQAYNSLGVGARPTDKKLRKRFDAAQKRLKAKGLL